MKLKDLPAGAKVSDSGRYFPWLIADQSGDPWPGTVLISDFLAEAGCYDAPEPDNRFDEMRQYGWNRYPMCNLHQWLNSTGENWFVPAHPQDCPPDAAHVPEPYAQKPGFLTGFSEKFLQALRQTEVVYAYKDDFYQYRHDSVTCRVFLPSLMELGQERRKTVQEGKPFELAQERIYLTAAPTPELTAAHHLCDRDFHPASSYCYWTRSADLEIMSAVHVSGMTREPFYQANRCSCGIRPCVVVDPDLELEEHADPYGVYLMKGAAT